MKTIILIFALSQLTLHAIGQHNVRGNRVSADTLKHSSINEIPSWPATGLKEFYYRDTLRGIDSLGIMYTLSKWDKTFFRELANDGENNIVITFPLNDNSKVFYNGSIIPQTSWSGKGTYRITLILETRKYDLLTINNGTQ